MDLRFQLISLITRYRLACHYHRVFRPASPWVRWRRILRAAAGRW